MSLDLEQARTDLAEASAVIDNPDAQYNWAARPFGFIDATTHNEAKAEALRKAYDDLLAGLPLTKLAAALNEADLVINHDKPWTASSLRPAQFRNALRTTSRQRSLLALAGDSRKAAARG